MKMTCIGRRPQILKVEYLSNHLSDHMQILNLSLDDQTIFLQILRMKTISKLTSNGRRPPMEDKVQWKTELQWKKTSNGRRHPLEDNHHWKTTYNGRRPQNIKN